MARPLCIAVPIRQHACEIFPCMRLRVARHLFRRSRSNDLAPLIAAFRPQIDQPVSRFDDVQVVLDHQQRAARLQQFAKRRQQFGDVVKMQTRRWLVENIKDAAIFRARQVRRQFQTLRFATG